MTYVGVLLFCAQFFVLFFNFERRAQLVRQHGFTEHELKIEVKNYPVDPTRQLIANILSITKIAFIGNGMLA